VVGFLGKKVIPPMIESIASFNDMAMVFQKGYRVIKERRIKNKVFRELKV
jgi:hypothetical protein